MAQESNSKTVDPRSVGRPKIVVAGVGGGGSNAVTRMYRERIAEVKYLAINTDSQALARCRATQRLSVGEDIARGLGVGGNPERGRQCHEASRDLIREHIEGSDLVFVAAGMGGGTGTGGAPVVAEVAHDSGALTVGVVTKPFSFEGSRRQRQAQAGIEELAKFVDTVIVIPNDRLLAISDQKLTMTAAFEMADDVLRNGIQSIAELILTPGEINLDFADVKSVMSNAGQAWMAMGRGVGPGRALKAARDAIDSPLLEVSVDGAKGIIFNVTAGEDLSLDEVQEIAEFISQIVSPNAHIFFGTTTDPKMEGEIRLTVIATGFPFSTGEGDVAPLTRSKMDSIVDNASELAKPPRERQVGGEPAASGEADNEADEADDAGEEPPADADTDDGDDGDDTEDPVDSADEPDKD